MDETKFKALLFKHFSVEPAELKFEEGEWYDQGDGKNNLSPRDRLLGIFKRRQRGVDPSHPIKKNLDNFVLELEELEFNSQLFSWNCCIEGRQYTGWASTDKIIYSVQIGKK